MNIKIMHVGELGTNCYLLEDETTNAAAIIDPGGEGERVLAQVQADGMEVKLILLTHAHFDHTGGVAALHKALPSCAPPCPGCRCTSTPPMPPCWVPVCSPPSALPPCPMRRGIP